MGKQKILCFGELLLRITASGEQILDPSASVRVFPGGSEANVAASLAQWDMDVSYMSRVPDQVLTDQALQHLKRLGVDTSPCLLGGDRLGLYFLLSANGLSSGDVVYDRNYSAFSQLQPGQIDWDEVLADYTWFHWSALTPALNVELAAVCKEALVAADRRGLTISVDLNYRSRLWNYGATPFEVMPKLLRYCDVVMGNIWAAKQMIGTSVSDALHRHTPVADYLAEAKRSAEEVFALLPKCRHLAYTFRFMDSPRHNLFYGTYHDRSAHFVSSPLETQEVIDRIGSGDAFMAGLIYALASGNAGQEVIDKATAAGFKKLFVAGDFGDGSI